MPRFNFSLQRVLDFRKQKEEQAQMTLAASERRLKNEQARLGELQNEMRLCEAEYRNRRHLSQGDLWLWGNYRLRLEAEINERESIIRRIEKKIKKQRKELVDRSKQRELLDKYKENQKKAFDYEQKQKEQKEFDETATTRFGYKTM
ncbi:MAG: flagellar export protein FliJ [Thermodesulfobacteriota bacterium]